MKPRDIPNDPGLEPTTRANGSGPFVGRPARRRIRRFAHHAALDELFLELQAGFGPQEWWPARTPFEVIVGAILTQNTAWTNVERALHGLTRRIPLTPARILGLAPPELEQAIRPSGYFRAKAAKLRAISEWYLAVGGLDALTSGSLDRVRTELLSVHGVGPETADSILCYGAGRRTVVVDTYTRRILGRHGLVDPELPYGSLRAWLQDRLVRSQSVYEEFHALCVRAGYAHCKPQARCETCPARTPAPEGRFSA